MEIIEVGGRKFRVPVLSSGDSKQNKKGKGMQMNDSKWFERIEKKMECKIGKIDNNLRKEDDSSSESGDDDLLNFWINGDEEPKKDTIKTQSSTIGGMPEAQITPILQREISEHNETTIKPLDEAYTYVLVIPLFECSNVKKRVDSFKKRIVDENPVYNRYLNNGVLHMPIMYLNAESDQLETLIQILSIPELVPTEKKKPKVDLQAVSFDCSGIKKDASSAITLFTSIRRNEEAAKMEEAVHQLISKLIEFGVCSEQNLANCRFDISAAKYKVEKWELNILRNGPFDVSPILNSAELKDFYFGTFDFNQITLHKTNNSMTQLASVKL